MKIETRAIAGFLKGPDPSLRAILIYGPDAGMIRERADILARTVVDDLKDPFRVADLPGDMIAKDPARLADEAAALAMTGGRRVVRVRDAGNDITPACQNFLADPKGDSLVIIEGGELDGRSVLRKLFEKVDNAAALPCYRDEARDLAPVIKETLAREKVSIDGDALTWLTQHLGGDRMVTRSEIEKLALYVGSGASASLEDVQAVVGDSAEIGFDDLAHATAGGNVAELERSRARLEGEGIPPVAQLRAVQRHFARLHQCAGMIAAGRDEKSAMMGLRPPVFWKEEAAFKAELRHWRPQRLTAALQRLLDAEIACKSPGAAAELITGACLLVLASER